MAQSKALKQPAWSPPNWLQLYAAAWGWALWRRNRST
jgi:hypothetical protein